jgi:heptosyltransferase-2
MGGPGDAPACAEIQSGFPIESVVNLCGKCSFLQTAALMQGAQMNYVNDSAPLHIASAMNAPVTAFYCSTIPAFGFGPLSDQSSVFEVETTLSCRPCGLHGKKACPLGHFKCGYEIAVEKTVV